VALQVAKPAGSAGGAHGDARQWFDEGAPDAVGSEATKPAGMDHERDRASLPGQIQQAAAIVAVNAT